MGAQTSEKTVCLVRHAETQWNLERRVQGHRESTLSVRGILQSAALGCHLAYQKRWDALYSSDLVRALQTARVIGERLNLPVRVEPDLRERGQGALEGLLSAQARSTHPDFNAPSVGREPVDVFSERCHAALRRIAEVPDEQDVVVVTHGGVIRELHGPGNGRGAPNSRVLPARNASFSLLSVREGALQWVRYDQTAHLESRDLLSAEADDILQRMMEGDLG